MRHERRLLPLLTAVLLAAGAASAFADPDSQSGRIMPVQFRPGVHGLDNGITDGSIQANPPSIGRGLGQNGDGRFRNGGLGQMRGDSLGAYGAGSIGEMGGGGLGALRGTDAGMQPPRPR